MDDNARISIVLYEFFVLLSGRVAGFLVEHPYIEE